MRQVARQALRFVLRHPALAAILALLLLVRAALPVVLRPVLVSHGSQAINGRLEIADVDVSLVRGVVTLQGVTVSAEGAGVGPVVACEELSVNLRWLPLRRRMVRFDGIRLVAPRIDIRRLEDGSINLFGLIPAGEATPEPAQPPEAPIDFEAGQGWNVAVDRVLVSRGEIWFEDRAQAGAERLHVEIADLDLRGASLRTGVYDSAASFELDARVEDAPVHAQGTIETLDAGLRVHAAAGVQGLPLRHTGPYVSALGWSGLQGALNLDVEYDLDGVTRNEVRGTVSARDLAVRVPDLEQDALVLKALSVEIPSIDLRARRAEVGSIKLTGLSLLLRPGDPRPLPLLAAAGGEDAPAKEPGDDAASRVDSQEHGSGQAWTWSVASVNLEDGHVQVVSPGAELDVQLSATARDISPVGPPWPVDATVLPGKGSITVHGVARTSPIGFAGTLEWQELDLPLLAGVSGAEPARLLAAGTARGSLKVVAGMPFEEVTVGTGDAHLSGRIGIDGFALREGESEEFAFGWERLDVDVSGADAPGVLDGTGGGQPQPVAIRISRVELAKPRLRLTRTASGLVVPATSARTDTPAEAPGEPPPASGRAEPKEGAAGSGVEPPAEPGSSAGVLPPDPGAAAADTRPGVAVRLAEFELSGGQLTFVDQTMEPHLRQRVSSIRLAARDVAWPESRVRELTLSTVGPGKARIKAKAGGDPTDMSLDLALTRVGLKPYNPYAIAQSGYGIQRGSASLTARVQLRENRYEIDNHLTLHDLRVSTKSGDNLFRDQFGIPLSLALALLRDAKGDIKLDVPVRSDRTGGRIGILTTIRSTLQRVILNGLAFPLKLLGAVNLFGGKIESFDVAPIPFSTGRAELDSAGEENVKRLATLLADRPGLALRLEGVVGEADIRSMREQQALERLGPSGPTPEPDDGAPGRLRRIREYLEKRVAGQQVQPDPSVQPIIEDLLSRETISAEYLGELAATRAERVRDLLVNQGGIDGNRIELLDPVRAAGETGAAVRVEIDAAS